MRLIDADALLLNIPETNVDIFENCRNCTTLTYEQVAEIVMAQKVIDVEYVRYGRWEDEQTYSSKVLVRNGDVMVQERCSICKCWDLRTLGSIPHKYCGNCGARMDWA